MSSMEGKKCVVCDTQQPSDGRMLRCLHIHCLTCLKNRVTTDGAVQCVSCRERTLPLICAVPLRMQLPRSRPLLYANTSGAATSTGSGAREQPVAANAEENGCDFCDEVATHSCENCDGSLLCATHVDKHRAKKRSHVIVKLAPDGEAGSEGLAACPVHEQHHVEKFCCACRHAVCQQCLALGHQEHEIEELTAAAEKQRMVIRKALGRPADWPQGSSDGGASAVTTTVERAPIAAALESASQDLATVEEDSEQASKLIMDTFSKLEEAMVKKKDDLLKRAEHIAWQQRKPIEERRQRFNVLDGQQSVAMEISERLCDTETSSNAVTAEFGQAVVSRLESLKSNTAKVQGERKLHRIQAWLESEAFEKILQDLDRVMDVASEELDLMERLRLHVPQCVPIGDGIVGVLSCSNDSVSRAEAAAEDDTSAACSAEASWGAPTASVFVDIPNTGSGLDSAVDASNAEPTIYSAHSAPASVPSLDQQGAGEWPPTVDRSALTTLPSYPYSRLETASPTPVAAAAVAVAATAPTIPRPCFKSSRSHYLHQLTVFITPPSGEKEAITIEACEPSSQPQAAALPTSRSADPDAMLRYRPEQEGLHRLTVWWGGDLLLSSDIQVHAGSAMIFDAKYSSRHIKLSEDCMVASVTEPDKSIYMFGNDHFTEGVYKWSVEVRGDSIGCGGLGVGIYAKQNSAVSRSLAEPKEIWFVWYDNSETYAYDRKRADGNATSTWRSGDMMTLKLDCSNASLEIHLHRTAETRVMTWSELQKGYIFYPYFPFYKGAKRSSFRLY